jgi:hypothetical protein
MAVTIGRKLGSLLAKRAGDGEPVGVVHVAVEQDSPDQ